MSKFSEFTQNALLYVKKLKESHPVTIIGILIGTFFGTALSIKDSLDYYSFSLFNTILIFGLMAACFFICGTFFFESIKLNISLKKKVILFIIWAFISIAWASTASNVSCLLGTEDIIENTVGTERMDMFTSGLILLFIVLGIYFSFKKNSEDTFQKYLVKAFSKCFMAGIMFAVLLIGILLLGLVAEELLLIDMEIIFRPLFSVILGLYFVPAAISAFANDNEEEPKLIRILIRYVMLIMSLAAYVIIYIYIIKIVVTWQIPSNSIFVILTGLFAVSITVSYLCNAYEKDGLLQKVAYGLPLVFVPFLFLQSYAVIIRIIEHGFTPSRYFGLLFIIFEIIYIVLYLIKYLKKQTADMSFMLPVLSVFIILAAILPGTNGIDLSKNLSVSTLKAYIEKRGFEVSYNEYNYHSRNASAYSYLKENIKAEELNKLFSNEDQEIFKNIKPNLIEKGEKQTRTFEERDIQYVYWSGEDAFTLDITDYAGIKKGKVQDYSVNEYDKEEPVKDASALKIIINDNEENFLIHDFEEYLSKLVEEHSYIMRQDDSETLDKNAEFSKILEAKRCISISENEDFYLMSMEMAYDKDTDELMSISMYGMLLTKN